MTDLNAKLTAARTAVDRLEDDLAAAYRQPLQAAGRGAARRFRSASALARTAASRPRWTPPDPNELVDTESLKAAARAAAAPIHQRALRIVGEATIGASFTVTNPFAAGLLTGVADKAASIVGGFADELGSAISDGYQQGLSVPKTAALIRDRADVASEVTARMLARTSLNSIANGASLAAAQLVNQASAEAGEESAGMKTWLTAGDERVRDTHADADGQTVPLDQPFEVGADLLMYPGDPDGSDEEVCNCRCVVTYGSGSETASARLIDEAMREYLDPVVNDLHAMFSAPLRVRRVLRAPTDALHSQATMEKAPEVTLTAGATGSTDLPLSARDATWDAGAARKSLQPADYPKAHFWRDPAGDPENLAAYKLPFAHRTGSGLEAVWRGVTAGAQRLSSTDIPAADKRAVQSKMSAYYAKARKAYDDDTIEAPFAVFERFAAFLSDFHLTAAAGEPTRWTATLLVEGEPTEDGRMIAADATTWRQLPLPLGLMVDTMHADDSTAPVCGRIDQIWRAGAIIQAAGVFDQSPVGAEAERLVSGGFITGISCDGVATESEIVVTAREPDPDETAEDAEVDDQVEQATGGEVVEEPDGYGDDFDYLFVATEYVVMGATICPAGAIANARISLAAGTLPPEWSIGREFTASLCEIAGTTTTNPVAETDAVASLLAALAASGKASRDALAELREEHIAEVASLRNEFRDGVRDLRGDQQAALIAAANETELLERVARVLAGVERKVDRTVELAERKPRKVSFDRDGDGRLAGLVED